jgi:SAM-dependent methyltransferase
MLNQKNWEDIFSKAVHGHLPPVKQALEASYGEAKEFLETGIIFEGAAVLDLGCGNGRQLVGLLEQKIGSYVGVDPIKESIEFCNREIVPAAEISRFIHIDLFNEFYNPNGKMKPEELVLPFTDATFDSVITGSVFTT